MRIVPKQSNPVASVEKETFFIRLLMNTFIHIEFNKMKPNERLLMIANATKFCFL